MTNDTISSPSSSSERLRSSAGRVKRSVKRAEKRAGGQGPVALASLDLAEEAAPAPAEGKRERKPMFSIGKKKKIKPDAVMAFSRQLSSFLEAGISLLDALETVAEETSSGPMREVIIDIRRSILRGTSFVEAVGAHPTVFPSYYRAMMVSAEYTGELDTVLTQLASYLDRDITARRQVKSAMTYPVIVLFVAIAAMIVMSVFVLPKFTGLYRSLGAELPMPTRMLLAYTDFMTSSWPIVLGVIGLVVVTMKLVFAGTRGRIRRDVVVTKLPLLGKLFHLISLERFCRVLAALAAAGVPLPEAISVSADSTGNSIFQARMAVVRDTLVRGSGVYVPMAATGLFPLAARQMIQVGEKTGALDKQLSKAAAFYEREVNFSMKRATELFEPIIIMLVGLIVGFVAVAQVSAMYSIFGQVK